MRGSWNTRWRGQPCQVRYEPTSMSLYMWSRKPLSSANCDRRQRHQVVLHAEIEEAATLADGGDARNQRRARQRGRDARWSRGAAPWRARRREPDGEPRGRIGQRAGDDGPGEQRELGDEADAPRAQQAERDDGHEVADAARGEGGAGQRRPPRRRRTDRRAASARCGIRPAGAGRACASGWRCSRARARPTGSRESAAPAPARRARRGARRRGRLSARAPSAYSASTAGARKKHEFAFAQTRPHGMSA